MNRNLKALEEQYRILTESSLFYVAIIHENKYLFVNNKMIDGLGYNRTDFDKMKLQQFLHVSEQQKFVEKIMALENGEVDRDHFECRYLTRAGESLWLEISAVVSQYGESPAILVHAVDVTATKKAQFKQHKLEAKLVKAKRLEAVGALAGGVAHDLNNILSGIVSYPELLLMDMSPEDPLVDSIKTIYKSGLNAAAIVQDLLILSRSGTAFMEVASLNDIINNYLQSDDYQELQSTHRSLEVATALETGLWNIKCSPEHLSKAVMSLFLNAAEAMPGGGHVLVSTENRYVANAMGAFDNVSEGRQVVFSIKDTGDSISSQDREKIFEPFYTKKIMGRSGTGLGMALARAAVETSGGHIDVHSNEGEGTLIKLYFPVAARSKS